MGNLCKGPAAVEVREKRSGSADDREKAFPRGGAPQTPPKGDGLMENLHFGLRTSIVGADLESVYKVRFDVPHLGVGMHGPVYRAVHRRTDTEYALKVLSLADTKSKADEEALMNELMVMSKIDHPNIAKLCEVFKTSTSIYMVIELCQGGELLDELNNNGTFSDAVGKRRAKEMVDVIRYLHDQSISHNDLKLENWLLSSKQANAPLKLIDFGFARRFVKDEILPAGAIGTQFYIAPEMLSGNRQYDEQVDMWSLGVIVFMCMVGKPPFWGDDYCATLELIKKGEYTFGSAESKISEGAKDFITKLLVLDPRKRLTPRQAQQHSWFTSKPDEQEPITGDVVTSLLQFQRLNAFQRTVCEVLAFVQLSTEELSLLRAEFMKFDSAGEGFITLEELQAALRATASNSFSSITDEEIQAIFTTLDYDRTGRIHWTEFLAATINVSKQDETMLRRAFDRLDCDGSGSITLQNLRDLCGGKMSDQEINEMIEDADIKQNGQIEWDEFIKAMKTVRRKNTLTSMTPPDVGKAPAAAAETVEELDLGEVDEVDSPKDTPTKQGEAKNTPEGKASENEVGASGEGEAPIEDKAPEAAESENTPEGKESENEASVPQGEAPTEDKAPEAPLDTEE